MKTWIRYTMAVTFIAAAVMLFFKIEWPGVVAGASLLLAAVSLLREPRLGAPVVKPGPLQESDGSISMRRCSAAFLFISAVGLFIIGALNDHRYAFFGGLSCLVGGVLMLFFTTWADLTGLVQAAGSLAGSSTSRVASLRSTLALPTAILEKASVSEADPPTDPSVGG